MVIPPDLVAVSSNRGAAYDLVLLAHVLTALVGFGAVAVAGLTPWCCPGGGRPAMSIRRYYRPGVNWAGRILFGVPVLGAILLVMSHGAWSWTTGWVTFGLLLWAGRPWPPKWCCGPRSGDSSSWWRRNVRHRAAPGTEPPGGRGGRRPGAGLRGGHRGDGGQALKGGRPG